MSVTRGSRLAVTPIYVCFEEDFAGSDRNTVEQLRRFVVSPHRQRTSPRTIDGHAYD